MEKQEGEVGGRRRKEKERKGGAKNRREAGWRSRREEKVGEAVGGSMVEKKEG